MLKEIQKVPLFFCSSQTSSKASLHVDVVRQGFKRALHSSCLHYISVPQINVVIYIDTLREGHSRCFRLWGRKMKSGGWQKLQGHLNYHSGNIQRYHLVDLLHLRTSKIVTHSLAKQDKQSTNIPQIQWHLINYIWTHKKHEIFCVVTNIIRPLSRVSIDILVLLLHKRTRGFFWTVWENFTHRVMMHLQLRWYITALYIKLRIITV